MLLTPNALQRLVGDVLAHLRALQPLPPRGILAGGAVANLIWNAMTDHTAPVNDIDIFVVRPAEDFGAICRNHGRYAEYSLLPRDYESFKDVSGVRHFFNQPKPRSLRMDGGTEGRINYVWFYTEVEHGRVAIDTCDLNCTMVGIDLETEELYAHEQFLRFLDTKKISICNFNSPVQSLLRVAKKVRELDARTDFNEQMLRVAGAMQLPHASNQLSDRDVVAFNRHLAVFGQYFALGEEKGEWVLQVPDDVVRARAASHLRAKGVENLHQLTQYATWVEGNREHELAWANYRFPKPKPPLERALGAPTWQEFFGLSSGGRGNGG